MANITTTSTSTKDYSPKHGRHDYGWECPKCGKVWAPWIACCNCGQNWTITCDDLVYRPNYDPEWWKTYVTCKGTSTQVQVDSDTIKIHPESTVYQVGGSDYKEKDTYVNVSGTQSNKVDPNITAWNCTNPNNCHTPHYTTKT